MCNTLDYIIYALQMRYKCCSAGPHYHCRWVNYYRKGKTVRTGLPVISYNLGSHMGNKNEKINTLERNTFFCFFFLNTKLVHSEHFCK